MDSFYGGAFFGGEFFNGSSPLTGGPPGRAKRRWAQIGDRVYHATDAEIREILDAHVREEEIEVPVQSRPVTKRKPLKTAVAVEVPAIAQDFKAEYVRYKQMEDEQMARMLLEAIQRADDDDVEMLLLH